MRVLRPSILRHSVLSPAAHPSARGRGTAMVMVIIISMVVAGLVMTMAWAASVQSQVTSNLTKVDAAFYAAEAGLQRAVWHARHGKLTASSGSLSETNPATGWSYSVTWPAPTSKTYTFTSVGASGACRTTLQLTATLGGSAIPAMTVGSAMVLKNLVINGNAAVSSNIDVSPGTGQVNGDLYYGGSILGWNPAKPVVTGDRVQGIPPGLNWNTLQSKLFQSAGFNIVLGNQNKTTFTFPSDDPHATIWVFGNVTDPTFVGSGTLVATGDIRFNKNAAVGTAQSPVNLVALGDFQNDRMLTLNGTLYTKGTWTRSLIDITGLAYAGQDIDQNNAGQSTITLGTVPWFDTRAANAGPATVTLSAFSGPTP